LSHTFIEFAFSRQVKRLIIYTHGDYFIGSLCFLLNGFFSFQLPILAPGASCAIIRL
jgi:hypothetical protein